MYLRSFYCALLVCGKLVIKMMFVLKKIIGDCKVTIKINDE